MTPKKTLLVAASMTAIAFAAPAHALGLNLGLGGDADVGIGIGSESSGIDLDLGLGADADVTLDGDTEGEDDGNVDIGIGVDGGITIEGDTEGGTEGNVGVGIGVDANANATVDGDGTDVLGDADADARVELVIGLIAQSAWDAEADLGDTATFTGTEALSVGLWLTSETEAMFQTTVDENMESITNLRTAIAANASLSAWLESEDVDVDTVVALGVTADGELVAFTE